MTGKSKMDTLPNGPIEGTEKKVGVPSTNLCLPPEGPDIMGIRILHGIISDLSIAQGEDRPYNVVLELHDRLPDEFTIRLISNHLFARVGYGTHDPFPLVEDPQGTYLVQVGSPPSREVRINTDHLFRRILRYERMANDTSLPEWAAGGRRPSAHSNFGIYVPFDVNGIHQGGSTISFPNSKIETIDTSAQRGGRRSNSCRDDINLLSTCYLPPSDLIEFLNHQKMVYDALKAHSASLEVFLNNYSKKRCN